MSADDTILAMYEAGEKIRRLLNRNLGADDAEEVLARSNLAAVEAVRSGVEILTPAAYMSGIIKNQTKTLYSENKRRPMDLEQSPEPAAVEPDVLTRMIEREDRNRGLSLVKTLPNATEREVIERFYVLDQDRADIVRDLGISPKQFDLAKWRGKARLAA